MALNTEAKRWSMLQLASGQAAYSHVINPDGSDIDTAVDRFTLLHRYGGLADQASAALTGTAAAGITEADIVAGGNTIVLTLTNDTWVASGATFNAQRQAIIDGLDSAQSETTGWNAEVRDKEVVTAVVRTSDTVVTITLSAAAAYDITANETITATIPAAALVSSSVAVVASPTFSVSFVAAAAATAGVGKRRRYPRWVVINGQRYRVDNAAEEARLLSAMADRAADDAKLAEALGDAAVAEVARKRAVRIRKRLTDTRKREDEWLAHLRAEDEELIALLH